MIDFGFFLQRQKRGQIPLFGGTSARDWRPFTLSGATINYATNTITISASAADDLVWPIAMATGLS